ncbi:MAG: restriction endonuclease subunit S [Lentisphaerota bacterium]
MKQGWEIKKLVDVCIVERGSSPRPIEKYQTDRSDGVNWIKIGDTKGVDKYIYSTKEKITKEGAEKSRYVKEGDFILSNSMSFGKPFIMKTDGYIHDGWFVLRLHKFINSEYFFNLLSSPYVNEQFHKLASGSVVKNISGDLVKKVVLPIPPLPEQQRIVAILDEAFTAIAKAKANAEQNLKNAKELFDCILNEILYDKSWEVRALGEICSKVEYGSSTKSKPEGKLPVLRMGNIQNGRFNWDSLVYSDDEEDNKQYLLKYNDVLFNRTNSPELVGKTAIYKSEMPAIFAGYLIRIHRKEDLLDADYLNFYLNSKMANEYGKTVVISSVNQANINGTKLKTYPIPLPKLKQQQAIVQKLDALSAETKRLEAIYQRKIEDLEELKKSVLAKAFKGEL